MASQGSTIVIFPNWSWCAFNLRIFNVMLNKLWHLNICGTCFFGFCKVQESILGYVSLPSSWLKKVFLHVLFVLQDKILSGSQKFCWSLTLWISTMYTFNFPCALVSIVLAVISYCCHIKKFIICLWCNDTCIVVAIVTVVITAAVDDLEVATFNLTLSKSRCK